jgi:hypothetical protein
MVLGAIAAFYFHRLGVRVAQIRRCEAAMGLQYYVAERVRQCAADPARFEWNDLSASVGQMKELMRLFDPGRRCSVTLDETRVYASYELGTERGA